MSKKVYRITWTLSHKGGKDDDLDEVVIWRQGKKPPHLSKCLAHLERETGRAFYLNVYAPDGRTLQLHIEGKRLRVWGEEIPHD